jgi:hypothetical protein
MSNILITFSGADYDRTTELIVRQGPELGADSVLVYDDYWFMGHPLVTGIQNQWLVDHPHKRGCLWYSWKPLVIWETLQHRCDHGDVVMFTDADCYPVKPFRHLYTECRHEGGIYLFRANPWKNYQWCKRDAFIVMGQDDASYHDGSLDAGVARFMLFEKGPWRATQFLMEWLTYCVNPRATTFDPSILGSEAPGFREHRTEQAIMTLLAYKYGIELHPELDYEQGIFHQDNDRPEQTRQQTAAVKGSQWRNV